jgi:hypothetical protein
VGDDEELVGLCEGDCVVLKAAFSLGGGGTMKAKHLNSYTEATLKELVRDKSGPWELLLPWLDETGLRRRLRDYQSSTLAKKAKSEGSDSPVLGPLDATRLCSPADVLLPVIGNDEPEFCAEEGWLTSVTESILEGLDQVETPTSRVSPMALVRCSRGGKTRALEELAHSLRKGQPGLSVVFVSFNNYSVIKEWEHADPVSALCRRIAFAALNLPHPSKHDYDAFAKTLVTVDDVVTWLHGSKCVLLIDELNLLKMSKSHAADFTDFLKTRFLLDAGRFFVFSSHVMPSSESLSNFMDNMSNRGVNLCQLPLIPSLVDARRKLECPTLAIREALFRARVPALISVTLGKGTPTFDKRQAALESVSTLWSDNHVMELLRSFVSGHAEHILEPLLQLMSSNRDGIVWIPFHMQHVLRSAADVERLSPSIHGALRIITDLLDAFERGKTGGGDSWEALFVIALLIRLMVKEDHSLLFLEDSTLHQCHVSYNKLWNGNYSFEDAKSLKDLLAGMVEPEQFPHVAVYYPPHSSFAIYDVIVAVYDSKKERTLRGYQLKEGREIPANPGTECFKSILIRGIAAQRRNELRQWVIASDDDIDSFLGTTGVTLAPKAWREMHE